MTKTDNPVGFASHQELIKMLKITMTAVNLEKNDSQLWMIFTCCLSGFQELHLVGIEVQIFFCSILFVYQSSTFLWRNSSK